MQKVHNDMDKTIPNQHNHNNNILMSMLMLQYMKFLFYVEIH